MVKGYAGKQIDVVEDRGTKLLIKNTNGSKFSTGADTFEVFVTDVVEFPDGYFGPVPGIASTAADTKA